MTQVIESIESIESIEDDLNVEEAMDSFSPVDGQLCIGLRHLTSGLLLAVVPVSIFLHTPSVQLEQCLLQYTLIPSRKVAPSLRLLRVVMSEERCFTIDCTWWIIRFQRRWRQRRRAFYQRHLFTRECTGRFPRWSKDK